MTTRNEQGEKTLSLRMQRAADTVQNLGRSVVGVLDIIPPSGAHALRRNKVGQLRVDEITLTEPRHSQESGNAFLSVEGVKQKPEQPIQREELDHQPLITHRDHIPPSHRPSWVEHKPRNY